MEAVALGDDALRIRLVAQGLVLADLLHQVVETHAFFLEFSVQGLAAHMTLPGQGVGVNPVGGHLPGNQATHLSAERAAGL